MAGWAAAIIPFLIAIAVLIVPGLAVAVAAGMRSMTALALAPVLSVSVLSVSAIAAPMLGMTWGLVPAVVGTLLSTGATFGLRVVFARRLGCKLGEVSRGYRMTLSAAIGLLFGASVILYRLLQIFGSPDYVSQTADNVFHLNAVRYIMETGNASSLVVGAAGGGPASFYPAAWHGIGALVAELSGNPIPAAVACVNLAIGAVAWPLSMWFLCRILLGNSARINLGFGILIAAFSAFPYLLVDWGVLYPNYLGMSILPSILGLCVIMFRRGSILMRHRVMLPWLALVGLAGISLSHPNTIICLIATVLPLGLVTSAAPGKLRRLKAEGAGKAALHASAAIAGLGSMLVLWLVLRPFPITSFNTTWPPYETTAQAVGEALSTTHSARPAAWATGLLTVLGLYLATRIRGQRWLAAAFAIWTLLFVAVAAWQPSMARAALTGGWFDDYKRIAAGIVVVAVPLALLGLSAVTRRLGMVFRVIRTPRVLGSVFAGSRNVGAVVAFVLVALPVFVVSQSGAVRDAAIAAKSNYSLRPGSPIMSRDEFDLYTEIPQFVPDNAVIAGNPWDGSAWAYFVSGRHVLYPHVLATMSPDKQLIASSLNQIADNPSVCSAVKRLNVEYAINSDELIYLPGNPNNAAYPGLEHLDSAAGFELVAQVGANRLYRIEPCNS